MFSQISRSSFWVRWGPALIMMGLIFAFSATPAQNLPNYGGLDFFVKKTGHMLEYALLAAAYWWGLDIRRPERRWLAWGLAILFACSDEYHQSFTPGRNPWLVDVGIDSLGALLGLTVATWLARLR